MKCAQCSIKGEIAIRHAGISLCREHFLHYVEKNVTHGIRETGVFKSGKVGVFLSGDAGSSVVLHVLAKVAKVRRAEVVAVGGSAVLARKLGVKHAHAKDETDAAAVARRLKLGCVVTGHCIEDFTIRGISLAMEGKGRRLERLNPSEGLLDIGVRAPCPLFRLYGGEVRQYAEMKGLLWGKGKGMGGLEKGIAELVERIEHGHPGTKHKLLKSLLYFGKESDP